MRSRCIRLFALCAHRAYLPAEIIVDVLEICGERLHVCMVMLKFFATGFSARVSAVSSKQL